MVKDKSNKDTNMKGKGGIEYYTPEETRQMMYNQSRQDKRNDYSKQGHYESHTKQKYTPTSQIDPSVTAEAKYKRHRRHKIESWIGIIGSLATILGVTITILGHNKDTTPRTNSTNTEKVYENKDASSDKPEPKPRVKIKRVVEKQKPKNQDNLIKKAQRLQQETDEARKDAKTSSDEAKKEADLLKTEIQNGTANEKMADKLKELEDKAQGYTQESNSPQPYKNSPSKFPDINTGQNANH